MAVVAVGMLKHRGVVYRGRGETGLTACRDVGGSGICDVVEVVRGK